MEMSRLYVSTLNLTLKFLYSVKNKPKKGNNEYMFQLEKKDPNYNFLKIIIACLRNLREPITTLLG